MQNTAIDAKSRPALAPRVRLQTDQVSGEPVLLFPEGLLKLNDTAQAVLACCDGQANVDGIISALAQEYEVDEDSLRADVLDCLMQLRDRRLIILAA